MTLSTEKLRNIYGKPVPAAEAKVICKFDNHCIDFIGNSPFLVLSTFNGKSMDVSPKGGTPGFVTIESETTLLLPDYAGNNRIDGLLNINKFAAVGLIFMIPGVTETLRVNGTAEVLDNPLLLEQANLENRPIKTVTRITVEEVFLHCGAAMVHAKLWKPETWPESRPISTIGRIVRDHVSITKNSYW